MEFGSGTGKHARLLAEGGFTVHGIELSASMVAKTTCVSGFTCQHGDIREVRLGRIFDAVLALFHVISYQTSNADLLAVFARAAEHLSTGGLFIFDFWYSPAVYTERPKVRVKRMNDAEVDVTRLAEPVICPNNNQVNVNYTIFARDKINGTVKTFTELHPMRHLSLPEIDFLANSQGFVRVCTEEFLTGIPAGEKTWGVCVTLKKI